MPCVTACHQIKRNPHPINIAWIVMFRARPINLTSHVSDISSMRFINYRNIFATTDIDELHGIYCWNEELAAKMMHLIGMIEVTLRNRIHYALSEFFHTHQATYCTVPVSGTSDSCNWYDHIYLKPGSKLHKSISGLKKDQQGNLLNPPPLPHKVISQLENGKWAHILKLNKSHNGTVIPWEDIFPVIFPATSDSLSDFSQDKTNRNRVVNRLHRVNKLRNRCAHFEPVWKFGNLLSEYNNSQVKPAPTNARSTLGRMQTEYRCLTELLEWLSPDMANYWMSARTHKELTFLMQSAGLENFRNASAVKTMSLSRMGRAHNVKALIRKQESVLLTDKGKVVGRFHPY